MPRDALIDLVLSALDRRRGQTAAEVVAVLGLEPARETKVRSVLRTLQASRAVRATLRRGNRGRPAVEYRRSG